MKLTLGFQRNSGLGWVEGLSSFPSFYELVCIRALSHRDGGLGAGGALRQLLWQGAVMAAMWGALYLASLAGLGPLAECVASPDLRGA